MGGEAGRRSGEPATAARGATSPSTPTPGRSTLVQALSQPQRAPAADVGGSTQVQLLPQPEGAAPAPAADEAISESAAPQATTDAAQGDAFLQGGVARIEGDTLFCPPDGALSATTPSEASTAPKKTDADYESALGVKAAAASSTLCTVPRKHQCFWLAFSNAASSPFEETAKRLALSRPRGRDSGLSGRVRKT